MKTNTINSLIVEIKFKHAIYIRNSHSSVRLIICDTALKFLDQLANLHSVALLYLVTLPWCGGATKHRWRYPIYEIFSDYLLPLDVTVLFLKLKKIQNAVDFDF